MRRCGELLGLWRRHKLEDVSDEVLTVETRFSSFDEYWSPFPEGQGPAGAHVATLLASDCEQLRLNLRTRPLGDGTNRAIMLDARACAVRGTVSSLGRW